MEGLMHKEQHFHLRSVSGSEVTPRGGATVFYYPNEDGTSTVSISLCSPSDNYQKRKGCNVSKGHQMVRSHKHDSYLTVIDALESGKNMIHEVSQEIIARKRQKYNERVQKMTNELLEYENFWNTLELVTKKKQKAS